MIDPATEELGGEEAVADYEVEVEEAATAEETAAAEAEAPADEQPPSPVAAAPAAAAVSPADDLTQLAASGPRRQPRSTAAGITTYAALAAVQRAAAPPCALRVRDAAAGQRATWPMQADYAAKGDWQGLMKRNQKSRPAASAAAAAARGSGGGGPGAAPTT